METFEETLAEGGSQTPEDKTLKEVPEASDLDGETQENRVRVCDDAKRGVVSVVKTRVVETEISVETSIVVENIDGVVDDGEVKNGSYSSVKVQQNGVEHGSGGENVNGSDSVLGVDKNDEKGTENIAAGGDSSLLIGSKKVNGSDAVGGVEEGVHNMAGLLIGGENFEGLESDLGVNMNDKNGVENMAAAEGSSSLIGGEKSKGSASVLGVNKNENNGVENMALGEGSSMLFGDSIERPKQETEVKEGNNLDNEASLNESDLGVNMNDKNGVENMAAAEGSSSLIGGEKSEGSASVLGVNKNEKNGVENMALGEGSSMLFGNSIERPKQEIEVKEGNNLDNEASLNGNSGGSDYPMLEVSEKKEEEGDNANDEEYEYSVGDFVWGKIKHHPWWPGQIYDPSDASEYALKYKQKDRYLVAYSGDGTFAWCNPSQLKPFEENFVEFSKQSNSKSFVNAVGVALEEIGGLVESKMTCSCVLKDNQIGLTRQIAGNAGVKEGIFMPECGNGKLTQFEPAQILTELKYISQVVSVVSMLELTVLKSKLLTFYRAKGGYPLPVYHFPQYIIGLEDNNQTGVIKNGDCNGQVDLSNQGPIEEYWLSSPGPTGVDNVSQSSLQKVPSISEDRLYQRRKQKSIADIINGEMDVEPKYQGQHMAKEGAYLSKPASTSRGRKTKANDEGEHHGGTTSSTSSGRRKKPKLVGVSTITDKDVPSVGKGGDGSGNETNKSPASMEKKENRSSHDETDGDTVKKESEMGYSPRERKKSRYLSPPFTNPERRERNSSSKRESEVGFLSVTSSPRIGERMSKAAGQLFASPPILKCSAETRKKKLPTPTKPGVEHDASGSSIPPTPKPAQKMVVDPIVIKAPANEVLSKFRYAALGHLYLREPKSLDMVRVFFSTFRGSIFRNGPYYKLYNKRRPGRKRKSVEPESGSLAKDFSLTDPISPESKPKKMRINKNQGHAADISESKKNEKGDEGNGSSAALLLTFGPGVSMPSKDDLIKTFSKFGPLDKGKTDVLFDSFCSQVVFIRSSDAEQAFKDSMSSNKDANITYRLRYLNPGLKIRELDDSPHPKPLSLPQDGGGASESSSLESIKQKLEMMTSMVDKSDGNMSQEMKVNLEGELKNLLEKVSTS